MIIVILTSCSLINYQPFVSPISQLIITQKNIRSDSGNGLPLTNAPPSWLTPECPKSGWKWSSENSKRKNWNSKLMFVGVEFTFILVEWIFRSMFHFYFALVHLLSLGTARDDDVG